MKIYCRGAYSNPPAGLYFAGPGVIEIDESKAEFLLRDAPENFTKDLSDGEKLVADKALDAPNGDRAVRAPARKK